MPQTKLVIDCLTGTEKVVPLSAAEQADYDARRVQATAAQAARAQADAQRQADLAALNGPATTVAQLKAQLDALKRLQGLG